MIEPEEEFCRNLILSEISDFPGITRSHHGPRLDALLRGYDWRSVLNKLIEEGRVTVAAKTVRGKVNTVLFIGDAYLNEFIRESTSESEGERPY